MSREPTHSEPPRAPDGAVESPRRALFRYRLRPEPRCEYLSSSITAIMGYTPAEFFADPYLAYSLVHPDDLPLLLQLAEDCKRRSRLLRWVRRDGQVVWTEHYYTPIRDAEGVLVAVEGVIEDVTADMQACPPVRSGATPPRRRSSSSPRRRRPRRASATASAPASSPPATTTTTRIATSSSHPKPARLGARYH
jgi:PAS domain S-box-containing protein